MYRNRKKEKRQCKGSLRPSESLHHITKELEIERTPRRNRLPSSKIPSWYTKKWQKKGEISCQTSTRPLLSSWLFTCKLRRLHPLLSQEGIKLLNNKLLLHHMFSLGSSYIISNIGGNEDLTQFIGKVTDPNAVFLYSLLQRSFIWDKV